MKTILIAKYKIDDFKKEFEAFVKKVSKFDMQAPTYTVGALRTVQQTFVIQNADGEGNDSSSTYLIDVYEVTIDVEESYKFNGWSLVGIVYHRLGVVNLVDVEKEYNTGIGLGYNVCDHCGKVHNNRLKSFIVEDEQHNMKQIGTSCSKDFLGMSPDAILSFSETLFNFDKDFNFDGEQGGSWGNNTNYLYGLIAVDLAHVLNIARYFISVDGKYIKKEYSDDWRRLGGKYRTNEGQATIDKMEEALDNNLVLPNYPELEVGFEDYLNSLPIETEERFNDEVSLGIFTKEDSLNNRIKALAGTTKIRKNEMYVAALAVNGYKKYLDTQAKIEANAHIKHQGVVGGKIQVEATITDLKVGEGMYGTWTLWTLVDEYGNTYKKFGEINIKYVTLQGDNTKDFVGIGDKVAFTAEVKSHEVFNHLPITQLGRLSKFSK